MGDRTSEASPNDLEGAEVPSVRPEPAPSGWTQLGLLPPSVITITTTLVVDGPQGELLASVTAEEFWTGKWIQCEVRPGLRFPDDLELAIEWQHELVRAWSAQVGPF